MNHGTDSDFKHNWYLWESLDEINADLYVRELRNHTVIWKCVAQYALAPSIFDFNEALDRQSAIDAWKLKHRYA